MLLAQSVIVDLKYDEARVEPPASELYSCSRNQFQVPQYLMHL